MHVHTQLSNKDVRLEQLQKELEVLATAKRQLDDQVNWHVQYTCTVVDFTQVSKVLIPLFDKYQINNYMHLQFAFCHFLFHIKHLMAYLFY